MNKNLRILIFFLSVITIIIAFRQYLGRDRDPMYYYNGLKDIKIGLFKNWHIIPRKGEDNFIIFSYHYNQINENNDTTEEVLDFGVEKNSLKINIPSGNKLSDTQFYNCFARLLNVDKNYVKDTLFTIINEYFKSKAFSILGAAIQYENFTSFDFGKNGNICLLYIPDEAYNEQRKRLLNGNTIINKNWSYLIREK